VNTIGGGGADVFRDLYGEAVAAVVVVVVLRVGLTRIDNDADDLFNVFLEGDGWRRL